MKSLQLIFLLLMLHHAGLSQWAIPTQMRAENTLDRLGDPGGLANSDLLYGVPLPPGKVIGDNYLDKKWNKATILLYQSETMIEGYPVKYDIKSNLIEITTSAGIKVLDVKKINSLVWIDSMTLFPRYFVNGSKYKIDGIPVAGLLEVLVDGTFPLLKKTELYVKQPNYNVALDVGSRDAKILQNEFFYYPREGQLTSVKTKKDILNVAEERAAEIDSFIKTNKLNVKKELDLIRVFEKLNSNNL